MHFDTDAQSTALAQFREDIRAAAEATGGPESYRRIEVAFDSWASSKDPQAWGEFTSTLATELGQQRAQEILADLMPFIGSP